MALTSPANHVVDDLDPVGPPCAVRDSADSVVSGDSDRPTNGRVCSMRRNGGRMNGFTDRSAVQSYSRRRTPRTGRDWLDEIQRNYKANVWPALLQLRLSRIFCRVKLSGDVLLPRMETQPYLALTMSSANNTNKYLKKIVVTPALNRLQVFTPSMEMGWLKLQVAVSYDWATRNWNLSYRAKTKWTKGSRIARKFQHVEGDKFTVCSNWTLKQELPQIGGSLGTHRPAKVEPDIGKFNLECNRVKASFRT